MPIAIELGAEFIHGRPTEIQWDNKREMQGCRWSVDKASLIPSRSKEKWMRFSRRLDSYTWRLTLPFAKYLESMQRKLPKSLAYGLRNMSKVSMRPIRERVGVHCLIQGIGRRKQMRERLFCLNDGYSTFAGIVASEQAELLLNTAVDQIRWFPGSVEIAGQRAQAAIVTLP